MAPVILLFSDLRQNGLLLTLDLRQNGLLLTLDLRQNGPILSPTCANVGPFYLRTCANKAFLFPAACATVFVFEYSGNTVGSKPNASGKLGRRSFLGMIKVGHKTDFLFLRYLRYPGPEPAQRLSETSFLNSVSFSIWRDEWTSFWAISAQLTEPIILKKKAWSLQNAFSRYL